MDARKMKKIIQYEALIRLKREIKEYGVFEYDYETMLDKQQHDLMNKRLNLLTIWSTIFLPLSFYTGVWGMNFDDVPLITEDHGFWLFAALTIITIVGMWTYFKKNKWI